MRRAGCTVCEKQPKGQTRRVHCAAPPCHASINAGRLLWIEEGSGPSGADVDAGFGLGVPILHKEGTLSLLQLVGAGCLTLVVLTHVAEALHLFPWMHWGMEHSVGHYLDLFSAIFGLMLFPLGYLLHAFTERQG